MRLLLFLFFITFSVAGQRPYFTNGFYSFHFKAQSNSMRLVSVDGDTLISGSSFRHQLIDIKTGDTMLMNGFASSNFFSMEKNLSIYSWTDSTSYFVMTFTAHFNPELDEIKIDIETTYKKDVLVIREAMLLQVAQPLKEVYRRNSLVDTAFFQSEYWLNKEGARFGTGKNTLLVYHAPGISSLQLNVPQNQLIINLDYANDHPFQYFPLRDSMMNEKKDFSCSIFKPGDTRKNSFTIHAGRALDFVPRMMLSPSGFLASHVFTEHADWTDLPTHRAVYFGSEKINTVKDATGGFIKNKIPVTKSVFYSNPDKVLNSDSRHSSIFETPIASIKGTSGFEDFLKQLQQEGNEICLHTPDQNTSRRSLIEDACAYMQKNFHSVTWIDHGYNNGPKNNREDFVCDGFNSASASYAKDIWEKYGVKYFWNSYYEDFVTGDSMFFDFYGSPMRPYPGFGDAAPQPLYWRSATRTGNFISWPTRDLLEIHEPHLWSYHFSKERMEDYIHQRAVKFEHCYPAGSIPDRGFWIKNEKNEIVVEPEFNQVLEMFAAYRDSGWINSTTVSNLIDYWLACENINFEYITNNTVRISNLNHSELKGVSFAVNAKKIFSDKKFEQKFFDGDLIFWFDMKPGESVTIVFGKD